ncbi:MAG: CYTH domain-containing protein [Muribaculum sp.]|nr:CYTH domain-containing protein [Muribaculaceae bacterium]MCM1080877.1 CYTH domain-containing protein [Muribaculum sp.]
MSKEIERKYLVTNYNFKAEATEKKHIRQGYLCTAPDTTVRVRTINGSVGYLTVKSRNVGATRGEWEYEIPVGDAEELLALCASAGIIDKVRYIVNYDGRQWEIDEFTSPCPGMVVAEIELGAEDESFRLPDFVGEEVTGNPAYYNSNMARKAENE